MPALRAGGMPANPIDRPGYRLVFHDEFGGSALDAAKWHAFYAPHWSSRERSRPRCTVADGALTLRIDPDQPPWCPEFDGGVKASSVQTGQFSGALGSPIGQLRFRDGLVVRQEQAESRLYVPQYGYFELRAKADISANNLVALFMIGFEDEPDNSGEITIMEIFGHNVLGEGTRLGHGIKRINDPRLRQEFFEDLLPFDPADWHIYAAEWLPSGVGFYLDNRLLREVKQSPAYPMLFMLNIYELPGIETSKRIRPASFTIDYFRGYMRTGAGLVDA
jgi:hypothetical protein